jgi:hypothetical protein
MVGKRTKPVEECLQGVEGNCRTDGNNVDDEADGRCDQNGINRDAQSWVHLREGIRERVATVTREGPTLHVSRERLKSIEMSHTM